MNIVNDENIGYQIQFKTSLDGYVLKNEYSNQALLIVDAKNYENIRSSVKIDKQIEETNLDTISLTIAKRNKTTLLK